jgi:hypothetical protein
MVQQIEPQQKLQVSLEYKSGFKKLTAQFSETLKSLKKKEQIAYSKEEEQSVPAS